jgi:hypothetical protein
VRKKIGWALFIQWCRRGESNRRATLKSRKLLILRIARNAKTARNGFHGYAAATRSPARDFMPVEIVSTQNVFRVRRPINRPTGSLFPKESGSVAYGSNQFLRETKISFLTGVLGVSPGFLCTQRRSVTDRWPRTALGAKDCRATTCRTGLAKGKFPQRGGHQGRQTLLFTQKLHVRSCINRAVHQFKSLVSSGLLTMGPLNAQPACGKLWSIRPQGVIKKVVGSWLDWL